MPECPDCLEEVDAWGTETYPDPAAPHREKTIKYCPSCGEVV